MSLTAVTCWQIFEMGVIHLGIYGMSQRVTSFLFFSCYYVLIIFEFYSLIHVFFYVFVSVNLTHRLQCHEWTLYIHMYVNYCFPTLWILLPSHCAKEAARETHHLPFFKNGWWPCRKLAWLRKRMICFAFADSRWKFFTHLVLKCREDNCSATYLF